MKNRMNKASPIATTVYTIRELEDELASGDETFGITGSDMYEHLTPAVALTPSFYDVAS